MTGTLPEKSISITKEYYTKEVRQLRGANSYGTSTVTPAMFKTEAIYPELK